MKNLTFRGDSIKINISGDLPKKGAGTVCRFKKGAWQKRGGVGGLIP